MRLTEMDVVGAVEELTLRRLRLWVRNGWILPLASNEGPLFDDIDVARIRLVCELKDALNLNEEAVAVVLSLLDQLYGVRRDLRTLEAAVEQQPRAVRRQIMESVRELAEN